jgi:hypothetical protein
VNDFTLPPRDFSWDASVLKELGATAGSAITVWPNAGSAGAEYDAQAGAGSGTATYQETPAGMPYVSFAQSYFELQASGIAWRYSGSADAGATIVVVLKMPQQGGRMERIFDFSRPGCQYEITMARRENWNWLGFSAFEASAYDNSAYVDSPDVFSGSSFQVFTGVSAATSIRLYKDGQLMGTVAGFTRRSDRTTTLNYLGLSCLGVGTWDAPLTAAVHEISIWRRVLSHAELAQLHAQLAAKWGIGMSLAPLPPSPPVPLKCACCWRLLSACMNVA